MDLNDNSTNVNPDDLGMIIKYHNPSDPYWSSAYILHNSVGHMFVRTYKVCAICNSRFDYLQKDAITYDSVTKRINSNTHFDPGTYETGFNRCFHCHMQELTYYNSRMTRNVITKIAAVSREKLKSFDPIWRDKVTLNDIVNEYPSTCNRSILTYDAPWMLNVG